MKNVQKNESRFTLHGVGRRKAAVARVWLKKGKGLISINGLDYVEYFDTDIARDTVVTPLKLVGLEKNYDVMVNVQGGGKIGQCEAVRLGIARAVLSSDESFRKVLRQNTLLTVDSRIKERKKYGQRGARRKFQFVKR